MRSGLMIDRVAQWDLPGKGTLTLRQAQGERDCLIKLISQPLVLSVSKRDSGERQLRVVRAGA
jgi:hypothetical protein